MSLGASKILVIKTSIKQNLRDIMKISFVAVIVEVILSCYALNYNILEKVFSLTNNDLNFLLLLSCWVLEAYCSLNKQKLYKNK